MRIRGAASVLAAGALVASGGALAATAHAEPVQQFSFQLSDTTADGRFTINFSSRAFDTTGGPPPELRENNIRLPGGARLRREFRRPSLWCDGGALIDAASWADPQPRLYNVLRNLDPAIRVMRRGRTRAERRYLATLQRCRRARIGTGTALIDARPGIEDVFPTDLFLYFGRPLRRGDVASISIVGIPQQDSAAVRRRDILIRGRAAVSLRIVSDPSPDGRYGYRMLLPTGRVQGFRISVAQVDVKATGLWTRANGRDLFWFTRPTCPPSGQISFEAFYGYDPPTEDITRTMSAPCPRYGR